MNLKEIKEAIEKINDLKPDLIFLDIQMPELTGFDVLEHIDHDPHVLMEDHRRIDQQ